MHIIHCSDLIFAEVIKHPDQKQLRFFQLILPGHNPLLKEPKPGTPYSKGNVNKTKRQSLGRRVFASQVRATQ